MPTLDGSDGEVGWQILPFWDRGSQGCRIISNKKKQQKDTMENVPKG
jgi:hypothetical protein